MATIYWQGQATAVAQVHTGSIDSVDATPANNTYTVTIGGVAVSQVGDTDVATTAAALVVLLNDSTHPYFAAVTWTNPSAGNIVGTADTTGAAFVAALTETGAGTGAVTDFAETTASAGPNDWSTAANWSGGAVPTSSDTVILRDSDVSIAHGLAQSAVTLPLLVIEQSYTGRIGLPYGAFSTSADGETTVSTAPEYRQTYLDIGWTRAEIGANPGIGSPAGSTRLKLDNAKSGASTTLVINTSTTSADAFLPAVRLLFAHASADVVVRGGSGGVGIAADAPGETTTMGDLNITGDGAVVRVGDGVTLSNVYCDGSNLRLDAAATLTLAHITGGTVAIEGDYTITTLTIDGGTVTDSHIQSSGNSVTTCNLRGGTLNWQVSDEVRTYNALVHTGGTLIDNPSVTITTHTRARATVSA